MDFRAIASFLAGHVRARAKDAGEACGVVGCDALTFGFRCDKCYRRLCNGHVGWKITFSPTTKPVEMKGYCPLCLFRMWSDVFADVEEHEPERTDRAEGEV